MVKNEECVWPSIQRFRWEVVGLFASVVRWMVGSVQAETRLFLLRVHTRAKQATRRNLSQEPSQRTGKRRERVDHDEQTRLIREWIVG